MTPFDFLLGSLATFRLSLLVSRESGPAFIFRKLRRLPPPKSSAKEGLACPLCLSVHFAALVTGFFFWRGDVAAWDIPLYWLAFSAAAICIHMQFTKGI